MIYAIINKTSQDEEQNQTTTNNNYIKKIMSVKKAKLNNKVIIASDKSETKQNKLKLTRKDMVPVQKSNFKVMKTIRNQLKYPLGLNLLVLLKIGTRNSPYSIFVGLQNEQQMDNKQKIS